MSIWNYRTKTRLIQELKLQTEGAMIICGNSTWVKKGAHWAKGKHDNWVDSDTELAEHLIWLDEKQGLSYTLY